MTTGNLGYNYHDSKLDQFELGPRRELNLTIFLDPIWNNNTEGVINLSFHGIDNYDQVTNFFSSHFANRPAPDAFLGEIEQIKKNGKTTYAINFSDLGQLIINCKNHSEK